MKSQTLPWFVINIIGTITFVIVLIAIITMQKNFYMSTKSLDSSTARMLIERTLLVSPNCLAHQSVKYVFVNGTNPHMEINSVLSPGVIDINKLNNFYNFNCLRYDMYKTLKTTTYAYKIKVFDINKSKIVFSGSSYVYGEKINCNKNYTDTIPVTIYYNEDTTDPAIMYITICEMSGNKTQDFCEMKMK